jgi:hypothetical protein
MTEIRLDIPGLVGKALDKADLDNRSRRILENRFGLASAGYSTLQELGDVYGITRERVRQIESLAVGRVRREVNDLSEKDKLIRFVEDYLNSCGGIRRHEETKKDLFSLFHHDGDNAVFGNQLKFIFLLAECPRYFPGDEFYHDFWYLDEDIYRRLRAIHAELLRKLKRVEHFEEILRQAIAPHRISEATAMSYLSVSKKIGVGPYGDLGLNDWEEINPKTVRAKIYLTLKKQSRPLHFREIAELTGCHAPTVHNELIKDGRFKLVRRGTYTL